MTDEKNETLAEIVARWLPHFQKYADPHIESAGFDMAGDAVSALEEVLEAAKRDGEMLKANLARVRELEGLLGGAADSLLRAATREKATNCHGLGNAAKLREALDKAQDVILCAARFAELGDMANVGEVDYDGALETIEAALAAPPRNCDVGTAEEQAQRYDKFCEEMDCVKCPVHFLWHHYFDICKNRKISCGLIWAQMPYEATAQEGASK